MSKDTGTTQDDAAHDENGSGASEAHTFVRDPLTDAVVFDVSSRKAGRVSHIHHDITGTAHIVAVNTGLFGSNSLMPLATATVSESGVWVPFRVTAFERGRRWAWSVAGVPATTHLVEPIAGGCRVTFGVPVLAAAYAPVCAVALRRIERLTTAERR